MTPPLLGAMAENAIAFGVFSAAMRPTEGDHPTVPHVMMAGAISGWVTSFWLTPIELVKCRTQTFPSKFSGPVDCLMECLRREGARGLFRGHTATMLRETPGGAMYFGAYEVCGRCISGWDTPQSERSSAAIMLSGRMGGIAYWTSTFPADTIKSRMQTTSAGVSMVSSLVTTVRKAGVASLYGGLKATLVRASLSNVAIFLVYEKLNAYLPNMGP